MKTTIKFKSIALIILQLLLLRSMSFAQIDTSNASNTYTGTNDSTFVDDSVKVRLPFLIKFIHSNDSVSFSNYTLNKKEINKLDYRYSGDLLNYLPFSTLYDLGYAGAPSEPKIFSFGFGNISLIADGYSLNNRWNNSSDLNRVQTESINSIYIAPLTRGFLYGFENNSSAIVINTKDTLKSQPISRIRYLQALNEEAFIDAFFSAKVMPKLAMSFRVTSIGSPDNYKNTEYGSWKIKVGGIYKLSERLYTKLTFNHLKLNTSLNGGINVGNQQSEVFNTLSDVVYNSMYNVNTMNLTSVSIYGKVIPNSFTKLQATYQYNTDILKRNADKVITDSTRIYNNNSYGSFSTTLSHAQTWKDFNIKLLAGFENIVFDIENFNYKRTQTNYYTSLLMDYHLFNKLVTPSIFAKYSKYGSQNNNGIGFDIKYIPFNNVKLLLGFSHYDKPLSLVESQYLSTDVKQTYNNMFASLEYNTNFLNSSISYFNAVSLNTPLPVFNNQDLNLNTTEIIYLQTAKIMTSGFNTNFKIEYWNILASANFNYYWQTKNTLKPLDAKFNLTAGLYYVDTLFNANLDLKTGFNFYLYDNIDYRVLNFQKLRSASYYLTNNTVTPFSFYNIGNKPYRLDFFLAGRIQNTATFYFVYENILSNNFYIIPYFPMPEGGIRIGISWDFLN